MRKKTKKSPKKRNADRSKIEHIKRGKSEIKNKLGEKRNNHYLRITEKKKIVKVASTISKSHHPITYHSENFDYLKRENYAQKARETYDDFTRCSDQFK